MFLLSISLTKSLYCHKIALAIWKSFHTNKITRRKSVSHKQQLSVLLVRHKKGFQLIGYKMCHNKVNLNTVMQHRPPVFLRLVPRGSLYMHIHYQELNINSDSLWFHLTTVDTCCSAPGSDFWCQHAVVICGTDLIILPIKLAENRKWWSCQ